MKRFLSITLSLVMVLALLAGCGGNNSSNTGGNGSKSSGSGDSSGGSVREDVIVRCEQVWYNLHPLEGIVGFPNLYILDQAYEALTRIDDEGVVQPRLATEWEISED